MDADHSEVVTEAEGSSLVRTRMSYADTVDLCEYWALTYGIEDEAPGMAEVKLSSAELACFRAFQGGADITECVPYATQRKNIVRNVLACIALLACALCGAAVMARDPGNPLLGAGVYAAWAGAMFVFCKVTEDKMHMPAPYDRGWLSRGLVTAPVIFSLLLLFIVGIKLIFDAGDWFIDALDYLIDPHST